jgi:aspartate carbamoyltransferase catalytic subunit
MHHLTRIGDLSMDEIEAVVERARGIEAGEVAQSDGFVAGLLFLGPSLRTRVGFASATARMGGSSIDVYEPRWSTDMSAAESIEDTVRTMSGMVDVLVVRTSAHDTRALAEISACPLVSGGDVVEHPTQALIDYWAILEERGDVGDLHIALVGDLGMRAATSLLRLLGQRLPRVVTLVSPLRRGPREDAVSVDLSGRVRLGEMNDLAEADVVYLVGLPAARGGHYLDDETRQSFSLTSDRLSWLREDAVVLSPMPVIDEITADGRVDSRVRLWGPSDRSVSMRQAVLADVLTPDQM